MNVMKTFKFTAILISCLTLLLGAGCQKQANVYEIDTELDDLIISETTSDQPAETVEDDVQQPDNRLQAGDFWLSFPETWSGVQVLDEPGGFGEEFHDTYLTYDAPGRVYKFYIEDDKYIFGITELETQYKHHESIPDDQTFFAETISHVYYWAPLEGATPEQLNEIPNIVKSISF